jgi:hypothetical protein
MDDIAERVKKLMEEHHVPVFGMGPSRALENATSGATPGETLKDAKGIFCMGIPMPKGLFQCGTRSLPTYWRAAAITYRQMDWILLQAARAIEEAGGAAVPLYG